MVRLDLLTCMERNRYRAACYFFFFFLRNSFRIGTLCNKSVLSIGSRESRQYHDRENISFSLSGWKGRREEACSSCADATILSIKQSKDPNSRPKHTHIIWNSQKFFNLIYYILENLKKIFLLYY